MWEGSKSLPLSILRPVEGTATVLQMDLLVKSMAKVIGTLPKRIQRFKIGKIHRVEE